MKSIVLIAFTSLALNGFSITKQTATENNFPLSQSVSAATQDMFGYFRTHRQGKGVSLNWSVTSMHEVAGFIVERSYDGDFFEVISQLQATSSMKYSWKDEGVFPGYTHYRIGCVMSDGTTHYTPVEIIRIVKHG
jgi:hypothetical protein